MFIKAMPSRIRRGLGQDDGVVYNDPGTSPGISVPDLTTPVNLSVSPLTLAAVGLVGLAWLVSTTKKTGKAIHRKGRAIGRALRV
jgi:hypothetical protein